MVYVAGVCGLRFAEIVGLRVGRLDFANRQLHVTETAPQVGPERAEPKTASGRRSVPMPGFLTSLLYGHLRRMELRAKDRDAPVVTAAGSEARRVGKRGGSQSRCRGSAQHQKKKNNNNYVIDTQNKT